MAGASMAATDHLRFISNIGGSTSGASALLGMGVFMWTGRSQALAVADRLGKQDEARYNKLWADLLQKTGFREATQKLFAAWRKVQDTALDMPKRQSATSLFALLRQADCLNDSLQRKLYDLCAKHGGTLHPSDVKGEARAFQKIFRSYRGDWRKLCDLCRASIVFDDVEEMRACLLGMGEVRLRHTVRMLLLSNGELTLPPA
jgi:hypothetical protein